MSLQRAVVPPAVLQHQQRRRSRHAPRARRLRRRKRCLLGKGRRRRKGRVSRCLLFNSTSRSHLLLGFLQSNIEEPHHPFTHTHVVSSVRLSSRALCVCVCVCVCVCACTLRVSLVCRIYVRTNTSMLTLLVLPLARYSSPLSFLHLLPSLSSYSSSSLPSRFPFLFLSLNILIQCLIRRK